MTREDQIALACERIDKVRKNRDRYLDLRGLGLTEFPQDISDLNFLFDLDISYNRFTLFPSVIGLLDNLQYLNCSNNGLIEFHLQPGKSYWYKEIDISYNHLNYIPEDLLSLDPNVIIKFSKNFFMEGLPPEIAQYEDLSYVSFYLDSLEKREVPKRLFETKILLVGKGEVGKTTLQQTLEDHNFKLEIGKENATEGIEIRTTYLPLVYPARKPYYNRFEDFGELLVWEEEIPIKPLHTIENALEDFSPFILWYSEEDTYALEIKVAEEPYSLNNNLFFEKEIKINFWDFGGQEILYSTHQFFLTKRSIYLLVWEPRSDTEIESFEYWLNIIKRLSSNSPVIVVMNKADVRIKQIDEDSLKRKFPDILNFHQVSCLTKEGIPLLVQSIKQAISLLPHIGDRLPSSWDKIRYKLQELNRDYITYQEFESLCGFNDDEKTNYLSSYLNDLGDIIHFQKDFHLKHLVIINPHWLTEAIYTLIHSLEVQKSLGKFKAGNLENLLNKQKYPWDKHLEIITLMEKFEICFKIVGSDNQYIIPSLLPAQPPKTKVVEAIFKEEALRADFQYSFLPSGIIERLICKMNSFIYSNNFWKYGVILHDENEKAVLILNSVEKIIQLRVTGELKAPLFQVIQHNLDDIHKSLNLKDKDVNVLLACNCSECSHSKNPSLFNKTTLMKFLTKKKKKIDCQNSTEEVDIQNLLRGFKSNHNFTSLLRPFVNAASALQARISMNKNSHEDTKNLYFADLLRPQIMEFGLIPNDQAQRGSSPMGKKSGELDILIEDGKGTPVSIYEGMHLRSLEKKNIDAHLKKTIDNYDKNGLKEKFIGVYSLSSDFDSLASGYLLHLSQSEILRNSKDISDNYSTGEELKIYRTEIQKYKNPTFLYHLIINLNFD